MAKYLNNQELFACTYCGQQARREEFLKVNTIRCPSCKHYQVYRQTDCAFINEGVEHLLTGIPGVFNFVYMGFGTIVVPPIIIEETEWELYPCEICRTDHDVTSCKITRMFDPVRQYIGFKEREYTLPGVDIVQGGGSFVIPFSTTSRLWIAGESVNPDEFYYPKDRKWEYFLQHQ